MTPDTPRRQVATPPEPPDRGPSPGLSPGLTIGELARRTGLQPPTLRMWEERYGFPTPHRMPSGHRRYDVGTVDLVHEVLRRRNQGVKLEVAVAEVSAAASAPAASVFAALRSSQPHLQPQRLRKSTLVALSRALEDECCARAQRPWLFGAFQKERYYRRSAPRWADMARTARGTWVLADFPPDAGSGAGATTAPASEGSPALRTPVRVGLPTSAEMNREWSVVCLAPDLPAALAAWELPGQAHVQEGDRLFESVWTVAPDVVRDAARSCARVVGELGVDTSAVIADAERPGSAGTGDLGLAVTLFNRVLAYVDRTA
jgi:DICT domain-containing protein